MYLLYLNRPLSVSGKEDVKAAKMCPMRRRQE
jgi:hypothetical protein